MRATAPFSRAVPKNASALFGARMRLPEAANGPGVSIPPGGYLRVLLDADHIEEHGHQLVQLAELQHMAQ